MSFFEPGDTTGGLALSLFANGSQITQDHPLELDTTESGYGLAHLYDTRKIPLTVQNLTSEPRTGRIKVSDYFGHSLSHKITVLPGV